jgi:hypothetical protein
VGGWLLFFCLVLSVLSPLATLVAFLKTYKETSLFFPRFPRLMVIIDIDVLLSLCLMTFSIYAGVWLWRVRPGAVSMAKRYLFCFLGYQAIASVLPFFAGLPPEANAAMLSGVGKDFFKGVVFFAVWYAYLSSSKRVRETYGL